REQGEPVRFARQSLREGLHGLEHRRQFAEHQRTDREALASQFHNLRLRHENIQIGSAHWRHPHNSTMRPNWPRSPWAGLSVSASTWPDSSNLSSSSVITDSSRAGLMATR